MYVFSKLLFAMCLFALPFQARAEIVKVPTIAIPPWGPNAVAPHGALVDLSRLIAAQMSTTPEFQVLPYKRIHAFARQCFSGFVLMPDHPEMRTISEDAAHLQDLEVVLYSRKDARVSEVSELEGKVVGLILGTELIPEINGNEKITKMEVEHPDQMVEMLVQKKVDAIVGLRPNCGLLAGGSPGACIELETVFAASHVRNVPLIAWTPACPAGQSLKRRVREAVNRLQMEGMLRRYAYAACWTNQVIFDPGRIDAKH